MGYTNPSIATSGELWAALQKGGLTATLEAIIAVANVATAKPTAAPTATATGGGASGGALAAGTYYFVQTESNGVGETLQSPEGSQLTVSATNIPRFTWPSLKTGNVSRRLYLGVVNGSSGGPYYLYATGKTASTFDASYAVLTNSYGLTQPPTVNTTAFTYVDANGNTRNRALQFVRAAEKGNLQTVYNFAALAIDSFLRGDAASFRSVEQSVRDAHTTFAAIAQAFADIGTLIDANAGSIVTTTNGIGNGTTQRTWP